jgi:hypothetical protein
MPACSRQVMLEAVLRPVETGQSVPPQLARRPNGLGNPVRCADLFLEAVAPTTTMPGRAQEG